MINMGVIKQNYKEEQVLNKTTGELENKTYKEIVSNKNLKKGYVRMYRDRYDEIMISVVSSKLDARMMITIRDTFTANRVESTLPVKELSEKLGTSRANVSKMITKLVNMEFLMRVSRGIYRLNPFIYLPYNCKDEKLQREWVELGGGNNE